MNESGIQDGLLGSIGLGELLRIAQAIPRSSRLFQRSRELLQDKLELGASFPIATAPRAPKFLTIGMATANDYDGFYFTTQAIRLYHPEILNDVELLVIDNGSELPCSKAIKDLGNWAPENFRYVPYRTHQGTAVRDLIFREATGEFVLSIDSHVLFEPGSLARLIEYCREHPDSKDLLQGPLLSDSLAVIGIQFDPVWSGGMYGTWGMDDRGLSPELPPFEIEMQGLGVFCSRRAAWPGFNPRLAGFGGEEGYIHEKIRRAGGRTLCLPFLRWLHRFNRPTGARYRNCWADRIRNYMLISDELGLDATPMIEHFEGHIGKDATDAAVREAQVEIGGPFHTIDAVYCISREDRQESWEAMQERFRGLGIHRKVRRIPGADTPLNRHIGSVLSHRRIVAEAKLQQLKTILVFEDENQFPPNAGAAMALSLAELEGREWQLSFLDGPAIAYHHSVYDAILDAVPDDALTVARMVRTLEYGAGDSMRQLLRLLGVESQEERKARTSPAVRLNALEVYGFA